MVAPLNDSSPPRDTTVSGLPFAGHGDDKMARAAVSQNINRFSKFSTVRMWNTQIREAADDGNPHKALDLYLQMKRKSVEPNNFTFPFVAKACAQLSEPRLSQMIHAHVLKSPFWSDVYVGSAVVGQYAKCGNLEFAHKVFEEMPERDVALWNVMLLGFTHSGSVGRFFDFFRRMRTEGVSPDSVTVIGLIQLVVELEDNLNLVRASHSITIHLGMSDDVSIANTVISAYSKSGDTVSAEDAFAGIAADSRTTVSWNSLLAGHALSGNNTETFDLYKRMISHGFAPDISSFVSILSSFVHPECLPHGMVIHAHVIQLGCDVSICVVNTTIAMYSKCGCLDSARQLFESMSSRTCVSWSVMIDCYAKKGNIDEALGLFLCMEEEKPDDVTMISLISGCGQAGSLEIGRWVDQYALSNGFRDSVIVCNALVDMYAKCGCIDEARRLFHSMPEKTEVSWTSMITGCALNGEFSEALSLFSRMVELCFKPNHITFLSVLQACRHAGFLEKGWECFNLMEKVYGVSPGLEHYSCMVDLLGRRGRVKEALELILEMPVRVRPDAGIWGALLNACKMHHNIEIGEYVAHRLFELEPETAASYVEMANLYASEGRWDGVLKIRALMKGKGVRKSPGQSFIEVNGSNHRFTAEESFHPECGRIYQALGALVLHLKEVVFSPYSKGFLNPDVGI